MAVVTGFSFFRLTGLIIKEFQQFIRDYTTFALIIGLPVVQLVLFGLAINTNPKNLPSALINFDNGPFGRTLVHQLENTEYFKFDHVPTSEDDAKKLIVTNKVLFTLTIPSDYSRKLVRGEYPSALLEVDGTDPVSIASALAAATNLSPTVFKYDLIGPLQSLNPKNGAAELRVHVKYNPTAITQYNIVPGLLGLILTMTFVLVASMALTKETELGTMESLLSTPLLPVEVIIGKSIPFLIVGYCQVFIVLLIARYFYNVPFLGSIFLLMGVTLPFILANLFVGIWFSTIAHSQLEASQTATFFFLPSILLSGFAFPFKGMPIWAQWIGNVLPLTHFNNMIRGIMLKGSTFSDVWVDLWPILVFMFIMVIFALKRYRQTLD